MKDYIMHKKAILEREDCESLINSFDNEKIKKIKGPINNYSKIHNEYFYELIGLDVTQYVFFMPLVEALEEYKLKYPFLSNKKFGNWGITRSCNFQKYYPGKFYSIEHCEHGYKENSNRIIAWMIYLNDIENGDGGTFFPQQKKILNPAAGDLYIWPAGWTHSHVGLEAKKDEKYILTGWCEFEEK